MSKMMGQAENARHVTTADFSGGLADFSVELRCFFDDEHTRIGPATFQHQRGGGAAERPADKCYVVIHREENDARSEVERQTGAAEFECSRGSMTAVRKAMLNSMVRVALQLLFKS